MARSALHAYTALLDRSFARIAEAAADGRTFDRAVIARCADVWDNNTFPLSATVVRRTAPRRERAARAGLRWMAGLGEARYAWMLEQSAAAGHPVEGLVPPPPPDDPGFPWSYAPLPPAETAVDGYDFSRCRPLRLLAEHSGDRLHVALDVEVPRACDPPEGDGTADRPAPRIFLSLEEVSEVGFDAEPAGTGPLEWRVDTDGVELRVGGAGLLRAARASLAVEDRHRHPAEPGPAPADRRSASFRRSAWFRWFRWFTERTPGPPFTVREGGSQRLAAVLVQRAMLDIRAARHSGSVSRRDILELCRIFEGAGTDLLAAARQGEAGGRALIERWVARGGDTRAGWFAEQLGSRSRPGRTGEWAERLADRLRAVPQPVAEPRPRPDRAVVRLLAVRFEGHGHDPDEPASAVVHLAVPPGEAGPWGLLVERTGPTGRLERFRLDTAAFGTAGAVREDGGRLAVGAGFALEWRSGESGQVDGGGRESVHDVA
ncbi:hypothetical protein ABTX81_25515 [Kitasatospora sp. NPDC097605]|uniref:hypothetical protein n=1 Tax=Kitasatospora sp. NPDC097605 TaxID=3157226 RepID=UPI00332C2337